MGIREEIQNRILLFDGSMGTMLQSLGAKTGHLPDLLNIEDPDMVLQVHKAYVEAGCDVVTANTFGSNCFQVEGTGYTVSEVIRAGIQNARRAGAAYVAQDIGPLGQLMAPMGTLSFQQAYDAFAEQVEAGVEAGCDVFIIETMSDIYEVKAAVLAVKEHSDLPVFVSLSYQQDGRTFVGCSPEVCVAVLEGLGVDALGANCSLGPKELFPVAEKLLKTAHIPVIIQANAGLPAMEDGKTVYRISVEDYVDAVIKLVDMGARIVGGCCGTTPEMMAGLKREIAKRAPVKTDVPRRTVLTSGTKLVMLDGNASIIGERINPTGKKLLKEAIRTSDFDYILSQALQQAESGADILDVNMGLPEINEPETLKQAVQEIQGCTDLPLQIDSADPAAIELAARFYNGKPLINSVNGKQSSLDAVLPIAKKYGALILGLTLDEDGIPETAEGRLAIAKRILDAAISYGIPKEDVLIDCLTLTASAQQEQAATALEAIRRVKSELGLKTVLGVSNISFGLPERETLNAAFTSAAFGAGLDAAIMNPLSRESMDIISAFRVVINQDKGAGAYIERFASKEPVQVQQNPDTVKPLDQLILSGERSKAAEATKELLKTGTPIEIINQYFIPALNEAGKRYESGEIFLPQLLRCAETVKEAFAVINASTEKPKETFKGKIVIATVYGDIHDIGKNIARMMLENYGYDVIDLGKDVPVQTVVETVMRENVKLVGLSALMTTTVKNMAETIQALKDAGADCKVMAGGAVFNEDYIALVGADYFSKDALEGVRIADRVFGGDE